MAFTVLVPVVDSIGKFKHKLSLISEAVLEKLIGGKPINPEFERAITCPSDQFVFLEHHRPKLYPRPFHFHPSIEINYLHDCDMLYSFSGNEIELKRGRFCVFWAAYPHRAVRVSKDGSITNAYVSLSEFLRWQIPSDFINNLLSGAVLCSKAESEDDRLLAERWSREVSDQSIEWQKLHVMEIQCRLNRLVVEGWDVLLAPNKVPPKKMIGGKAVTQFENMLRFVTANYSEKITIDDVAKAGGISPNYAMSLFRKILGNTIKEHIVDTRIFHAKTLLMDTNDKILSIAMDCGFGSLSAFYETFQHKMSISPAAFRKSVKSSEAEE